MKYKKLPVPSVVLSKVGSWNRTGSLSDVNTTSTSTVWAPFLCAVSKPEVWQDNSRFNMQNNHVVVVIFIEVYLRYK
mgnify:CR=1 FL=1